MYGGVSAGSAVQSGSFLRIAATASSVSSRSPPLAIMTGSTTRLGSSSSLIVAATAQTIAAVPSRPVWTAAGGRSRPTAPRRATDGPGGTTPTHATHRRRGGVAPVAAGVVATPWTSQRDHQHASVAAVGPRHRSATPEDCAEAVIGLIRNTYITGQVIVVDGGITLVW